MLLRLAKLTVVMFLSFGVVEHSFGQVIVDLEFDNNKAKYLSNYSFGGYGPADGSEVVSFDDKISSEYFEETSAGRPASLAGLEAKLEELKDAAGDDRKAIQAKVDELAKADNSCAKLEFDTSAVELPSDVMFDYAGVGLCVTFDLTDVELPSLKADDYQVAFDAKVAGTETLSHSKLMINFVSEDGDDEDDYDDIIVQLVRGDDDGTNTFAINSQYQTFTFGLESMYEKQGAMTDLKDVKITGITFCVQAQGNVADFGSDKDNVLYVDNIRLIKK